MLWKIENTPHFLVGSIHVRSAKETAIPKKLIEAFQSTKETVFEADVSDPRLQTFGIDSSLSHLDTQNALCIYERATNLLKTIGINHVIDAFKPWKASFAMNYHILCSQGFDFNNGIDQKLREYSLADRRTISYLESPLRSLQCFDSLPNDYCLKFLEEVVGNPIKAVEITTNLVKAWNRQDLSTIDNLLNSLLSEHFDLYSDLVLRRNEEWLHKLINEILPNDTPKLIVVGILHCVGDNGIVNLMLDHNIQTTVLKSALQSV
jgi:uncharacterized protein YbaP (TraB family)